MDQNGLAGSLIIAAYLNWGLLGLLVLQSYNYYLAFPRDRPIAKIMVYSVLLLELTQTAVSSYDIYMSLASPFGSPDALEAIHHHWLTVPVFGALTGGIGQFFFAYRIWSLTDSKEKGTPIIIGLLGLASSSSGIVAGVTFFKAKSFTHLMQDGNNLAAIGIWNGFGSLCDIVIALCMPYYLMRHGTGLRSTHIKIVNLIRLIIETGMVTAFVAILHFCLYFIKTTTFLIPGLTISKVYGNTMLVILNNRIKILNGRFPTESVDNLDEVITVGAPRSPGVRDRSVYTLPADRKTVSTGGSIVVTRDRLIFRLNPDTQRGLQSTSEGETHSVRESVQSGQIYGHAYGSDMDIPLSNVSQSHGHDSKE